MPTIDLNKHYRISSDVVAREIEGELVIIPIKSGMGDLDSEMYSLNTTGIAVWHKLDGTRPLAVVIKELSQKYDSSFDDIKTDVVSLVMELVEKGLAIEL